MKHYKTSRSQAMFERARGSIAGGVGSIARSLGAGFEPYPIFVERGEGSRIYDVDGNEYIDYLLAFGPLIFGHRPQQVIQSVIDTLNYQGSMLGLPHRLEYEVSELMKQAVPSLDLVRFNNSGSEAVMSAIRVARAFSGKEKIIRFEGMYHGWTDAIHFSSAPLLPVAGLEHAPRSLPASVGIPDCLAETVIVQPWNNFEVLEKTIKNRKHEIAAVITEPVMGNAGCIPPREGYLQFLRKITQENDILLIFDEVITGFRLALGGAQEYFGISPDLSTFAKAIGGGFPIAAFGGKREIMDLVATNKVVHSGTYNTNPTVMAAAKAVLNTMMQNPGLFRHLHEIGNATQEGIKNKLDAAGVQVTVQGVGPMFQFWFSDRPINNYREAVLYSKPSQYRHFYHAMLKRGVLFHPAQFENWFVSTAHTAGDLAQTLEIVEDAMVEAKKNF